MSYYFVVIVSHFWDITNAQPFKAFFKLSGLRIDFINVDQGIIPNTNIRSI